MHTFSSPVLLALSSHWTGLEELVRGKIAPCWANSRQPSEAAMKAAFFPRNKASHFSRHRDGEHRSAVRR